MRRRQAPPLTTARTQTTPPTTTDRGSRQVLTRATLIYREIRCTIIQVSTLLSLAPRLDSIGAGDIFFTTYLPKLYQRKTPPPYYQGGVHSDHRNDPARRGGRPKRCRVWEADNCLSPDRSRVSLRSIRAGARTATPPLTCLTVLHARTPPLTRGPPRARLHLAQHRDRTQPAQWIDTHHRTRPQPPPRPHTRVPPHHANKRVSCSHRYGQRNRTSPGDSTAIDPPPPTTRRPNAQLIPDLCDVLASIRHNPAP